MTTGCLAEVDDPKMDEEDLGEVQQELLGDITCATSSNTDWVNMYGCDLVGGSSACSYATGTTNYQSDWTSGEDCQPYLTVRTQTTPYPSNYPIDLTYWAIDNDATITTQATCEKLRIELAAYYYDANGSSWYLTGTQTASGVWSGGRASSRFRRLTAQ